MTITTDTPVLRVLEIPLEGGPVLKMTIARTTSGNEPARITINGPVYLQEMFPEWLEAMYAAWKAFEADKRPREVVATLYQFVYREPMPTWKRQIWYLTRQIWMGMDYAQHPQKAILLDMGYHLILGSVTEEFAGFANFFEAKPRTIYDDETVVVVYDEGERRVEVQKRGTA